MSRRTVACLMLLFVVSCQSQHQRFVQVQDDGTNFQQFQSQPAAGFEQSSFNGPSKFRTTKFAGGNSEASSSRGGATFASQSQFGRQTFAPSSFAGASQPPTNQFRGSSRRFPTTPALQSHAPSPTPSFEFGQAARSFSPSAASQSAFSDPDFSLLNSVPVPTQTTTRAPNTFVNIEEPVVRPVDTRFTDPAPSFNSFQARPQTFQPQPQPQAVFRPQPQPQPQSTFLSNVQQPAFRPAEPQKQRFAAQTATPRFNAQSTRSQDEEKVFREQAQSAKYSFASNIDDNISGNQHQREEVRDGLAVKGMYSYSDGYVKRTVFYEADENGYRVVKQEEEPLGDGPQVNPNGQANVRTFVSGNDLQYSITSADIQNIKAPVAFKEEPFAREPFSGEQTFAREQSFNRNQGFNRGSTSFGRQQQFA